MENKGSLLEYFQNGGNTKTGSKHGYLLYLFE